VVTQDEQFIDWFLPEDDSVETDVKDIHVTTATSVKGVAPKRKTRSRIRRPQVTRPLPIWIVLAIAAGGLIGTVAAGRFELIPVWSAFAGLCWLLRTVAEASRRLAARTAHAPLPDIAATAVTPPASTDDLTFEPLVRSKPPGEGEEPLSSILVEDSGDFGYRNAWVIVTFLVTNRSDTPFAFICNRLKLRWCGQAMDLEPMDMINWNVDPYKATKVSTISHIWTDEIPEFVHTTTGELTVCVECLTTERELEIGVRPRVWKTELRPAFSDEGPIHLAAGPVGAKASSRVHAAV